MTGKQKRKRGRPRHERTTRVQVRLPVSIYDAYCRQAIRAGEDNVGTVIRDALVLHAKLRAGMLPAIAPELHRAIAMAIRASRTS